MAERSSAIPTPYIPKLTYDLSQKTVDGFDQQAKEYTDNIVKHVKLGKSIQVDYEVREVKDFEADANDIPYKIVKFWAYRKEKSGKRIHSSSRRAVG